MILDVAGFYWPVVWRLMIISFDRKIVEELLNNFFCKGHGTTANFYFDEIQESE